MFNPLVIKYGKLITMREIQLIGGGCIWLNVGTHCIVMDLIKYSNNKPEKYNIRSYSMSQVTLTFLN